MQFKTLLMVGVIMIPLTLAVQPGQAGHDPYCRKFTKSVRVNGHIEARYGKICLQPDGFWQVVSHGGGFDDNDHHHHYHKKKKHKIKKNRRHKEYAYPYSDDYGYGQYHYRRENGIMCARAGLTAPKKQR